MTNVPRIVVLALALLSVGSSSASAVYTQLPDLVPLPPTGMTIATADDPIDGEALRFDVTTRNAGAWDLDLLGLPRDFAHASAQQCITWTAPVICQQRVEVGDFVWHPAHGHWHFDDFARYELRSFDPSGEPDMTPGGLVAGGQKVTFCLADTEEPEAGSGSPVGRFTAFCPGAVQGISSGWADTYTRNLPGQQIILTDVPMGRYALVVTIDPEDRLFESDETNNTAWVDVTLAAD